MEEPNYRVPGGDILQGDIYLSMPSVHVASLPMRAARFWKKQGERDIYSIHSIGGLEPKDGFKWSLDAGGEKSTLVSGYLSMGIVMSHDCTIENDDGHRTIAMVRPITDIANLEDREPILNFDRTAAFPLLAQEAEPKMELSFVDFRRLTTVRPAVLATATRYAQCSERIRTALSEYFWEFLCREYRQARPPRSEVPDDN